METTSSTAVTVDAGTEAERNLLLITYILHALAPFNGLTSVIAVIISHIKINETGSAFVRSHYSWLIRTFWWGLLWSVICGVLTFVLIGAFGFVVLGVWWLYRVIRGFLNYSDRKPMPV